MGYHCAVKLQNLPFLCWGDASLQGYQLKPFQVFLVRSSAEQLKSLINGSKTLFRSRYRLVKQEMFLINSVQLLVWFALETTRNQVNVSSIAFDFCAFESKIIPYVIFAG